MQNLKLLPFYFLLLTFLGCATVPYAPKPKPEIGIPGIYHRVEKGQTLWRISKIYTIELDEIVRINRISDARDIEVGQLIFIPYAQKKQPLSSAVRTNDDFTWPIRGRVISTFGQAFNNMVNKGINISPLNTSDVVASRSGKVIFYTDDFKGFGKTIIIDHQDGFSTVYTRIAQVFVKVGDYIQKGALIAKAGSAGRDRNIYLHFEIRKGHIPQNPLFYLAR